MNKTADGILNATHSGVLPQGNIPCYVLEDGRRVLSGRGMEKAIGITSGKITTTAAQSGHFIGSNSISPFICNDLKVLLNNPVVFKCPTGIAHGYEATVLIDLCNAVLEARQARVLKPNQIHIAEQCETIVRAFAKIGIIAVVDEITGYQDVRQTDALQKLLAKYLLDIPQTWHRLFPPDFVLEIARLHDWQGWRESDIQHIHHIRYCGKETRNIIYNRIPKEVSQAIDDRNPRVATGENGRWIKRKKEMFRFLTPALGEEHVKTLISQSLAVMGGYAPGEWQLFLRHWNKIHPLAGQELIKQDDGITFVPFTQVCFAFED